MKTISIPERVDRGGWNDDPQQEPVVPLTRAQAQALQASTPRVSLLRVIAVQALAGLVVAAVCWGASGRIELGWSALYGAAAAVAPAAVMGWGIGALSGSGPAINIMRFMAWEGVKVMLALAMLSIASRVVPQLNWPALLVALVVCMKVNWLAPLWRGRRHKSSVK